MQYKFAAEWLTVSEAKTEIMCPQTKGGGKVSFTINAAGLLYKQYCLRSPFRLGKACCEARPSRLVASGGGLSGGCKAGLTLKE